MVTLIIPIFNKIELTRVCLESVLKNSQNLTAVFVIDNASEDDTADVLRIFQVRFEEKDIKFTVIRNTRNLGFGAACNQGIRLSKTNYTAVLNNDTWVMPGWDTALMQAQREKKWGVVGPFFDERPWVDGMEERAKIFLRDNPAQYRTHFVPILMFFTHEAIAKLRFPDGGIFDERFFVTYEDTDLLHRMKMSDITYAQTSLCYIWHHSMGTRSSLPDGYEAASLEKFKAKWGFDPRPLEHGWIEKWKRRMRKKRSARGQF